MLRSCLLVGAIDVVLSVYEQLLGAEGLRRATIGRKVALAEFCSAILLIVIFFFAAYKLASNSVRNTDLQQLPISLEEWLFGISAPLLLLMAILILTKLIPIPIVALYTAFTEKVQFWEDTVDALLRVSTGLARDLLAPLLWDFSLWLVLAISCVRFPYSVTRRQMVLPGPWTFALTPLVILLSIEGAIFVGLKVSFYVLQLVTDMGPTWPKPFLNLWVRSLSHVVQHVFVFVLACLMVRISLRRDLARFEGSFFPRE